MEQEMNALVVKMTGEVQETNFSEWKEQFTTAVELAKNKEISSLELYKDAQETVKRCTAGVKAIDEAKDAALSQTADIKKVFEELDTLRKTLTSAKGTIEKNRKAWMDQQRNKAIAEGREKILIKLGEAKNEHPQIVSLYTENVSNPLNAAVKGKTAPESIEKAVGNVVREQIDIITGHALLISQNKKVLAPEFKNDRSMYQDYSQLVCKPHEIVVSEIEKRQAMQEADRLRKEEAARVAAASEPVEEEQGEKQAPEPAAAQVRMTIPAGLPKDASAPEEPADEWWEVVTYVKGSNDDAVAIARAINARVGKSECVARIRLPREIKEEDAMS